MARLRAVLDRSFDFYAFSILVLALVLLPVQGDPSFAPPQQSTSSNTSATQAAAAGATHTLEGALWRVDGGFASTIKIKNALMNQGVIVVPVLYMADGTPYPLRSLLLGPGAIGSLSVNDALADAPSLLAGHISGYGSVALQYSAPTQGAIVADLQILNVAASLDFDYPLLDKGSDPSATHTLEAVWWKHGPATGGFVALANTTDQPRNVSLQALGSQGTALPELPVQLAPFQTQLLYLDGLLGGLPEQEAQAGGIRIQYEGSVSDVLFAGGLENDAEGFSAVMPDFLHDPGSAPASEATYASAGLFVGRPDSSLGFPTGTQFTPYTILRNATGRVLEVAAKVSLMLDGAPRTLALPTQSLPPFRTQAVTLDALLAQAGLAGYSGTLTLAFSFQGQPGDLALATGSVDQTGNYVFEVVPQPVGANWIKAVPFWSVADGWDTMISLWNPAAAAADDIVATFTWTATSGSYSLPIHLAAGASLNLDLRELIATAQPDARGNVIPANVEEGSVSFASAGGPTQPIEFVVSAGIFNVQTATCYPLCICCGQVPTLSVSPDPVLCPVKQSMQATALASYSNGTTGDVTGQSSWTSNNTAIATVETKTQSNPGLISGVSVGSTSILVCYLYTYGRACAPNYNCPTSQVCVTIPVNVLQVSQSPSQFNMSTSDTKQITVSVTPSNVAVTTSFSNTLTQNPDSSCAVSLSIPGQSGQGSLTSNVTASPPGCSGEFQATASASGVQSTNSTTVDVPPQVLIQMMVGEASTAGTNAQLAVGVAARNRFGDTTFFKGDTNYQNTIVPTQFNGIDTSITTGVEPELDNAASVWLRVTGNFITPSGGNASQCFWSPSATQWAQISAAVQSGTTDESQVPNATGCYSGAVYKQQIRVVTAVGTNSGIPWFVFQGQRPSSSSPVAIQF